jgi:hypothetical protein
MRLVHTSLVANKYDASGKLINAWHEEYITSYEPGFRSAIRYDSAKISNGKLHASKSKAVRESAVALAMPIESFPKTKPKTTKSSRTTA